MAKDTKYESMEKTLSAVGKEVFVRFYYDFKDKEISDEELSLKLLRENPRTISANQNFRIPRARHIFKTGQELKALNYIIKSVRLSGEVKELARVILERETFSNLTNEDIEDEKFLIELNSDVIYSEDLKFEYDNRPKSSKQERTITATKYPRSKTVSKNALAKANYLCEVDNSHWVFKRRNSNKTYTEPHHLVPLSAHKDFKNIDLDREQNVVSLCSHCHNLLHYGEDVDQVLKPLYEARKELLEKVGIFVSYEQLKKYY